MKILLSYFKDKKENAAKNRSIDAETTKKPVPERVQQAIEAYRKK